MEALGRKRLKNMEQIIGAATGAGNGAAPPIKESSTKDFMADVMDASVDAPVIVDFWAPWCGPCKQLTPALEKAVTAARGAVRMVKVNIDENQELAQQFRIQSVPTIYAFKNGQPVDGFQGALPESQIKTWVENLIKSHGGAPASSPIDEALAAASEAMQAGDAGGAGALYGQVLAQEPANTKAIAGLTKCYLEAGDLEGARALIDGVSGEAAADGDVAAARSSLELAESAAGAAGQTDAARARLAANPDDHQARFDLALALYGGGQAEDAIDELVELVRRDRGWNDQAARTQLLKIFEALGPMHELAVGGRRKLSAVLFT